MRRHQRDDATLSNRPACVISLVASTAPPNLTDTLQNIERKGGGVAKARSLKAVSYGSQAVGNTMPEGSVLAKKGSGEHADERQ